MKNEEKWIYVFADETGTVGLNDIQSQYFGMGFFCTEKPEEIAKVVAKAKYDNWQTLSGNINHRGKLVDYFHATNDSEPMRKAFMKALIDSKLCEDSFVFIYFNKNTLASELNKITENNDFSHFNIKKILGGMSVVYYKFLIYQFLLSHTDIFDCQIFLVLSTLFSNKENSEIKDSLFKNFQKIESSKFKNDLKIAFTPNQNDTCAQVADYISWYSYNYLTRNQSSYIEAVESFFKKNNDGNLFIYDITSYLLQSVIKVNNEVSEK